MTTAQIIAWTFGCIASLVVFGCAMEGDRWALWTGAVALAVGTVVALLVVLA